MDDGWPVRLRPRGEAVVADVVEGEAVIINVETGIYYSTSGAGGWVWSNIAAAAPCAMIRQHLAERGVEPAALHDFFDELSAEGLVEEAAEGADALVDEVSVPEAPKLLAYRDMQDLMALDPPMPMLDTPR